MLKNLSFLFLEFYKKKVINCLSVVTILDVGIFASANSFLTWLSAWTLSSLFKSDALCFLTIFFILGTCTINCQKFSTGPVYWCVYSSRTGLFHYGGDQICNRHCNLTLVKKGVVPVCSSRGMSHMFSKGFPSLWNCSSDCRRSGFSKPRCGYMLVNGPLLPYPLN